ncbi:MAG TPA: PhnA domain-containing protein [Flavisolibacter sp.]|jgi:protein PhnA|nr:PhnA domain-containing protein [Flavisolibacter sp.]
MKLEDVLQQRSGGNCELCGATEGLQPFEVQPQDARTEENTILLCAKCRIQVEKKEELDSAHWRKALPESMWSEVPGVQVTAWRMLNRLRNESWAADNLDVLYLDDENLAWAKATGDHESDGSVDLHKDSNGAVLQTGDTVVLTKSLDVKGSTLNAKMGTVVKNIRLVENNTEQIEGRIEGQVIVILTKYVRKQNS